MPFHTTPKTAQNLESEIHNTDVFSQALSVDRLKERQDAAERLNSTFGWNVSVEYGETIEKENEIIDSNVVEEINEAAAPESKAAEDPEESAADGQ